MIMVHMIIIMELIILNNRMLIVIIKIILDQMVIIHLMLEIVNKSIIKNFIHITMHKIITMIIVTVDIFYDYYNIFK
jgi:hypothetical protein